MIYRVVIDMNSTTSYQYGFQITATPENKDL